MRLVVGLRNPGARYEGTRHNVGAEAVERLAAELGWSFRRAPGRIRAEVAEGRVDEVRAVLALPGTFMNESGGAVSGLVRYYRVGCADLLVVHDDIDLPFGKLRVRFGGSSGGNNGVRSIIGAVGTDEFWRLKIGVGRPPARMDPADYVLSRFSKAERRVVDLVVDDAAEVAAVFVVDGGEAARRRAGELNARREEAVP
ncbi:MAG TPA: aminoacyl-tRNA hydrolase [Actinobacteria bacterium]|nr:aminoacyl-tRNA hydrolase [Actinomycetota bacterium]